MKFLAALYYIFTALIFAVTIPENGQTTIAVQGRGTGSLGRQTLLYFPDNSAPTLAKTKSSRPALRSTQPPIQWVPGALSPGVKRKKVWIYISTPQTPSWRSA
jgi:hypothetical protein